MDPAQKDDTTMKTLEITLPVTETTETVDVLTPAVGRARFAALWERHFPGDEVPAELHTSKLWAGVDGVDALATLAADLRADAQRIEVVGDRGYVLLAGQGEGGSDCWTQYRAA